MPLVQRLPTYRHRKYNMKTHAIIPIFIPHKGCPHNCIFCNQKKITAHIAPVTADDVVETIETWLTTLSHVKTVEIAFYGGSFTAIPMEDQTAYLKIAKRYKDAGKVNKIHLSTRPDAINKEILDNLRAYGVDTIELGVQSFDDRVLKLSGRGHDSAIVYKSSKMIQDYGFELGIQLMIGLPGDSMETCIYSAKETVKIGPELARLYPTIVIEDTELFEQYKRGEYKPLSQDEAVERTKEMYKILQKAGINIIRVGLKSSDIINENGDIDGGTFHPAFRQLVEGAIAREKLESQLQAEAGVARRAELTGRAGTARSPFVQEEREKVDFFSNSRNFSNMIGNSGRNKEYFLENYRQYDILYRVDNGLKDGEYAVIIKNGD
ncbi:radical SAM family protein [Aminicella lysinilytica]|uniref:Radical SAM family protein n=2 Tax=Aminicella lysinilytica TaxID=433323 RepID=A0A4R6QAA5_9FIRM|nr:radical SAM family protein [Aminicella lysinilytica]